MSPSNSGNNRRYDFVFASERFLLNHAKTGGSWPLEEPELRLDHSELLCNKVLLKYKGDRESF